MHQADRDPDDVLLDGRVDLHSGAAWKG